MLTQQQSVRPGPVQSHVTAVQSAGAKATPVVSIRDSSTPQAKSAVAANLSPVALTNLSPDSFFGSYQDPQNQDGSLGPYLKRYYLYKANDTLVVGGQAPVLGAYLNAVPAGNNVSIQATNLIIAASFPPIPQGDIQIYCRQLAIPAGTVTIDVSATADDDGDKQMAQAPVKQAAEGEWYRRREGMGARQFECQGPVVSTARSLVWGSDRLCVRPERRKRRKYHDHLRRASARWHPDPQRQWPERV